MTENQRSGENNSNGAPSVQSPPPSAQQEPQQHQPQREVEELQREIARNNDKAEHHQRYLNEFRVEACPLFKQHQCQQHRPFTCFKWHFQNQRRRRPVRKPDGSFNYSPDIYCDKYDENTGICPDGDDCIYLHRVSGDVERKYHLRYYKTAQCVHPTDISGECVKNGAHCAFAHSSHDIRQPMYDQNDTGFSTSVDGEGRDKASFVIEDPQWHSQDHVLSFYKTDQCRKPARLCRQGYACPFYHNSKDRRRPPAVYKYRSTPCPAAKNIDEWLDPEMCEAGDSCQYCHTRTEQQFHPEIYKSTKCNDMLEHGYCPRAVFCAFAHHDSELHAQRNPYVGSSQASPKEQCSPIANSNGFNMSSEQLQFGSPISNGIAPSYSSVLKQRQPIPTGKVYSSTDLISSSYPKAPGYERSPLSVSSAGTFDMRNELGRHRTHSLNMGNFDGIQKSMFINGGMPTIDGNSTSSLCRSDSGFNAVTETSLGTFDELNLDLAPIEEHSNQTFGSIFGNSPMRNEHDPFGNAGYFPPSFPLPTMDGQSNEFEDFNKQRYQEQEKINNYEDALKKCRQLCEFYKNRAERAEIERDLAMQQLNNLHLHGGAASGFMPSVQSLSSPLAINPTTNQTTNGGDAVLEGGIRPSASLQHSPPYNIFGNDCDAGAPACARCGRDRSRSGSDSQSSCPVCST